VVVQVDSDALQEIDDFREVLFHFQREVPDSGVHIQHALAIADPHHACPGCLGQKSLGILKQREDPFLTGHPPWPPYESTFGG
jgi:hypothetical protein